MISSSIRRLIFILTVAGVVGFVVTVPVGLGTTALLMLVDEWVVIKTIQR